MSEQPKPVVLCILDGWGHREAADHNAIYAAATPVWDALWRDCQTSLVDASEMEVGLPTGQMGNSEVGHMNIGAGRVMMQDLPRIDQAIADGSLAAMPALVSYIDTLKASGGACHLIGLLSDGGVHAHQHHIQTLATIIAAAGVPVKLHAFLDGRDTSPKSAAGYVAACNEALGNIPGVTLATISGRYFAMDRDKRWDRVQKAYDAMVHAEGNKAADAVAAIEASYAEGVTDEFILPTALGDYAGMQPEDGVLMANFRADRAREILHSLLDPGFEGFARRHFPILSQSLGMVEYSTDLAPLIPALFPPELPDNTLAEVLEAQGRTQLHIAETEKYAHVTFFFNGGREEPFPHEDRILIPSPNVATYDLQPEMSAPEVTDNLVDAIAANRYDFIVVNYANTDMVGHTGDMQAAIQAVQAVDTCLGRLKEAVEKAGGVLLITADHGNAEMMHDDSKQESHTAHTLNKVPFVLYTPRSEWQGVSLHDGRLADIAPTVLDLMGITQPEDMTGRSLLARETHA